MKHEAILAKLQRSLPQTANRLKEAKTTDQFEINIDYFSDTNEVIGTCSGDVDGNITDVLGGFIYGDDDVLSAGAVQFPNPQCGKTFSSGFSSNGMQRYRGKQIDFIVIVIAEEAGEQEMYLAFAEINIPS